MPRVLIAVFVAAASLAGSACFNFNNSTSPTSISSALGGAWTTVESLPGSSGSLQDSCINYSWNVTEFNGTTGSGTFSATCFGNVQISGTAKGTLVGSTLNWSATATGTVPGLPPCAINLAGTATIEGTNRIRIPYSGTTCLGPVSGTEIIQR
jgi:hypothetical protein